MFEKAGEIWREMCKVHLRFVPIEGHTPPTPSPSTFIRYGNNLLLAHQGETTIILAGIIVFLLYICVDALTPPRTARYSLPLLLLIFVSLTNRI